MKPSTTTTRLFLSISVLGCFTLLPKALAVSPPPDGGYPGGNTAEGQNALFSLTTGQFNTGVGWFSLKSLSTGNFNTGVGAGTLVLNTADQNTATGAGALLSNTTGTQNTANGAFALFGNTTGNNNNAFGFEALFSNTTGPFNNAFGNGAMLANTTGDRNTAMGDGAMLANTTGSQNTAIGVSALRNNTAGFGNIAIGQDACSQSQGGQYNTAVGWAALEHNAGNFDTANGADALFSNTTGSNNTANGIDALGLNTTGNDNTAIGAGTLVNNTTGSGNIALGANAGINVTTAVNNICIGIGGENVPNACYIGQTFGTVCLGGTPVFINGVGQLGTTTSSQRFKEKIKPMEHSSEALFALKPVTFRYKKGIDPQGIPQFGLVAEEVEKVSPSLVIRDAEGKPYTVRYDAVNAMLLNEFLKEHRKVEELQATVVQQQKSFQSKLEGQEKQIAVLASDLRKIDAQFELRKSEQHVAIENHRTQICATP